MCATGWCSIGFSDVAAIGSIGNATNVDDAPASIVVAIGAAIGVAFVRTTIGAIVDVGAVCVKASANAAAIEPNDATVVLAAMTTVRRRRGAATAEGVALKPGTALFINATSISGST